MFLVVAILTFIDGGTDTFGKRRFESYAEADDYASELRTNILPEMGGVVDWQVLMTNHGKVEGKWSMDDEQPYYEHRILIRDNMDAAHFKAHRFIVKD